MTDPYWIFTHGILKSRYGVKPKRKGSAVTCLAIFGFVCLAIFLFIFWPEVRGGMMTGS